MKKQLFLGLIMIFFLGTSLFAGFSEPNGTEKPAVKNTKEVKLSDEEMSHLTRRAETDNLPTSVKSKDSGTSNNKLMPSKQVVVEGRHRHGYILYGGGTVILIIILVLLLA